MALYSLSLLSRLLNVPAVAGLFLLGLALIGSGINRSNPRVFVRGWPGSERVPGR